MSAPTTEVDFPVGTAVTVTRDCPGFWFHFKPGTVVEVDGDRRRLEMPHYDQIEYHWFEVGHLAPQGYRPRRRP